MNKSKQSKYSVNQLLGGLSLGDRVSLSRAITLIESTKKEDKVAAEKLIEGTLPMSGKSLRIGITGVPGVGKSTFIESFGELIIKKNKRLAVLSVDPSSSRTKGSILGDKTRMPGLSVLESVYIRPSPSGNSLGGVAHGTREAILLCEAAGYDVIIIETVGVGQSETMVQEMVDFFLLLMLPGSGDELQGIKRGIMEMVDGIFINKSDGNLERAKRTKKDFQNALHLFPPTPSGWKIPVEMGSAIKQTGLDVLWKQIEEFESLVKSNGWFENNRTDQNLGWFHHLLRQKMEEKFLSSKNLRERIERAKSDISHSRISVRSAVNDIF